MICICNVTLDQSLTQLEEAKPDFFNLEKDRPAQSLEPPWGRASRFQRCSGSAATEQDLCKNVIAPSKVNWATTLDCVLKKHSTRR